MKHAMVFMATGFEEMELTIIVDILRRGDVQVETVSLSDKIELVKGSHDIKMMPDTIISQIDISKYDLVALPGGMEGTHNLRENQMVIELIQKMNNAKKIIAAICAAPMVLVAAKIVDGKNVTSHPFVMGDMTNTKYSEAPVVIDGNIITSRAPGTTFEFAYTLLEMLMGDEIVQKIKKETLWNIA